MKSSWSAYTWMLAFTVNSTGRLAFGQLLRLNPKLLK
jgi:hypothetical protein